MFSQTRLCGRHGPICSQRSTNRFSAVSSSTWTLMDSTVSGQQLTAIEKQRCGDFKSLLATNEIKRFMGKEKERVPYLKRLQDIGFADTALAAISTAPRAA